MLSGLKFIDQGLLLQSFQTEICNQKKLVPKHGNFTILTGKLLKKSSETVSTSLATVKSGHPAQC